ncbi:MAG: polysaccharide deacetylase [Clostridiaceae bacterium]|jgi:hypothetical protein|nr:polysaccharide deacetylase [Clostridiaceae bacterium]
MKGIDDLIYIGYYLKSRLLKESLYKRYGNLCRQVGLRKPYFILSLDCDTVEDIKVVWELHLRLMDQGVCPVYAVPGELLKKGSEIYRDISETGAEFINHGYREHTYFDQYTGTYRSCFFYDCISQELVEKDILEGDLALKEILGIEAMGFRAPHFGTIQSGGFLAHINAFLKDLNYKFSTSTMPYYGFRYGPIFNKWGITEIPLSGTWSRPLQVLDSWGCFYAPDRTFEAQDYLTEGSKVVSFCKNKEVPAVFNYYVDPSHIYNKNEFLEMVKTWINYAQPVSYSQLLKEVNYEYA